jgi:hypothetical protein
LTSEHSKDSTVEEHIVQLIKGENPENIQQLIKLIQNKLVLSEKEAHKHVMRLVNEQKIKLTQPPKPVQSSLNTYLGSGKAYWFWITIALVAATTTAVFTISEDAYPIVYVRYALGTIFVLFLPGYALIKALFPSKREIDEIERTSLSIGLSLAIVPMIGLLLNYTPWGITLTPITLSLLALTTILATVAVIREFQTKTNSPQTTAKTQN